MPRLFSYCFLSQKNEEGRSLGPQSECESFLVLGILHFQKQLPSYPTVVLFSCSAFSVPNRLHPHSTHTLLAADQLGPARDPQGTLYLLFSEFPSPFISNL